MKRRLFAGFICTILLIGMTAMPVLGENLKYGSEGSQVVQAQTRLSVLGFYQGEADGEFGYSTFLAVKGFQAANGLTADGVIGEATIARLYSDGALDNNGAAGGSGWHLRVAYGSAGPVVSLIQGLLRNLNYYSGSVDAKFGFSTFLAVKEFQGLNGLTVDGIVGPLTWIRLQDPAAVTKPADPPPGPTPTSDPTEVPPLRLAYGDAGALVGQVQVRLNALGYYNGVIDSKFGFMTYLAVQDFQYNNALKMDGVVGPLTWDKLFGPAALPKPIATAEPKVLRVAYGDESALVTQVQTRLTNLGYYELPVDGKFGYATYLSVRDFQVQNSLKVDGIVGPFTWNQMMGPAAIAK